MAPHSSTLAWKIPCTEDPGTLQTMGSLRVGHDWATSLSRIGEGHGNPLQCSCLENPRDGGAWWAALYGAAQSRTRLKRLSSSSIILYAQLKVYKLPLKIKLQALLKAWSPLVILSCFLFSPFLFCSSFRTYNWSWGRGERGPLGPLTCLGF